MKDEKLLQAAKKVLYDCRYQYIPDDKRGSSIDSWELDMKSTMMLLEEYIEKGDEKILFPCVQMASVRLKCFQIMMKKDIWVTPFELSDIERKIWTMLSNLKRNNLQ